MNYKFWTKSFWVKPKDVIYVSIILDKPFQSISTEEPARPYIKITGLGLNEAAKRLPGKGINWHTVPMGIRAKLELSPWETELSWDEMKGLILG